MISALHDRYSTSTLLADEGEEYLRKAELAGSDEEKLAILQNGLAKKQEWVEKLMDAKDALMDEAPSDDPDDLDHEDDLDYDESGAKISDLDPEPTSQEDTTQQGGDQRGTEGG